MVMFDSLNRRFLQSYGCTETITPNFLRLQKRAAQFENSYAASLPCIPARRELHTGRYNFLHRSWGPMEPFDDSAPRILRENGVHSHLVSDHGHYWEDGGSTYHTQYSTWENIRGEEGDMWKPLAGGVEDDEPNFTSFEEGLRRRLYRQNLVNRTAFRRKEDYPLVKTFDAGMSFLRDNADRDSWFLQIESFSPHEPFMASEEYKRLYPGTEPGRRYEWPDYAPVKESPEVIGQVRNAYFAALSMCDEQLSRVLDFMDEHDMWDDTMLIVNTDHGYMLSEHGFWAKNYMPCYDEIAHTPLYVWDPRFPQAAGQSRNSLVQTIDLPAALLDFFGLSRPADMQGRPLSPVLADDTPIRSCGLFGIFGAHICCTDGRYVYMRAPRDLTVPLHEYTLMPTHMMGFFSRGELSTMQRHPGFSFTKGLPVMQIESDPAMRCIEKGDLLFDLWEDPRQEHPIEDEALTRRFTSEIERLMRATDAPYELLVRFGFRPDKT